MPFIEGEAYNRQQIHDAVGGGLQDYLPHRDGRVVAACLRQDKNRRAPDYILVGSGEQTRKWADVLCGQKDSIPVFLRRASREWLHVGRFRVIRASEDRETLTQHRKASGRFDIVKVIKMQKV